MNSLLREFWEVIFMDPRKANCLWELKLKIVTGIANAVAYLHHGLSKTIIHRGIKPTNFFLDGNGTAKLFDFQDAIPIPEGETHVDTKLLGTLWLLIRSRLKSTARRNVESSHAIPTSSSSSSSSSSSEDETDLHLEARFKGRYTEKSGVYGFGVLLCEVLTGTRIHELVSWHSENSDRRRNSDLRIHSDDFLGEIIAEYHEIYQQEENRGKVMEYVKLGLRCVKISPDERPNMIEVEKALRLIKTI